jgi:hypothetical protein
LGHDPRRTFVLDASETNIEIDPVYRNAALVAASAGALLDAISGRSVNSSNGRDITFFLHFQEWAHHHHSNSSDPFIFRDYSWRTYLIANPWIFISRSPVEAYLPNEEAKNNGYILPKKGSGSIVTTIDWTGDPPMELSFHATWARSIDWANTPLGPMNLWSSQLHSNASLVMQGTRPAVGFYGRDLIMIYNEAYTKLLRGLYPCMGGSARVVLASVWVEHFEPIVKLNLAGETVDSANVEIPTVRDGFLEETIFSTRLVPIFDSEGATIGHYEPVVGTVGVHQITSSIQFLSNSLNGFCVRSSQNYLKTDEL